MRKKENALDLTITLRELRDLCIEYDRACGEYPENPYEGAAFFNDLMRTMTVGNEGALERHMFIRSDEVEK